MESKYSTMRCRVCISGVLHDCTDVSIRGFLNFFYFLCIRTMHKKIYFYINIFYIVRVPKGMYVMCTYIHLVTTCTKGHMM